VPGQLEKHGQFSQAVPAQGPLAADRERGEGRRRSRGVGGRRRSPPRRSTPDPEEAGTLATEELDADPQEQEAWSGGGG